MKLSSDTKFTLKINIIIIGDDDDDDDDEDEDEDDKSVQMIRNLNHYYLSRFVRCFKKWAPRKKWLWVKKINFVKMMMKMIFVND